MSTCPWCERLAGDPACDCDRVANLARECGALVEQAVAELSSYIPAATHASGEMRAGMSPTQPRQSGRPARVGGPEARGSGQVIEPRRVAV